MFKSALAWFKYLLIETVEIGLSNSSFTYFLFRDLNKNPFSPEYPNVS